MAQESDVNAAKVRALDAFAKFLEVLTALARAAEKEISDRGKNPPEAGAGERRGRS